jgi:DNA-binding GntR family transcriptional regulator
MPKNSSQDAGTRPVKQPAHQAVYANLRDQILFGEMAPGQAVTIQGLTEQLDAGMTPVREAIRRLTSEGALNMMGNRRVIVPELTEDCLEELEFMRETLEPQLARRAVRHITDIDLDMLKSLDDGLNTAIEMGDIGAYLKQNYRFHAAVYTMARAPIIAATVDRLWLQFGPSLRVVCGRYGTLNLPDKHADLLKALDSGDEKAAERAMAGDVHQGMSQIRNALRSSIRLD